MLAPTAAQFGTATLMVGVIGLSVSFWRDVDLQRRSHAMTEPDLDGALASSCRHFLAHYLWALLCLYLALRWFASLSNRVATLAVANALAEHASQECCRTVLVTGRQVLLTAVNAVRALTLAALVVFHAFVDREWLTSDTGLWRRAAQRNPSAPSSLLLAFWLAASAWTFVSSPIGFSKAGLVLAWFVAFALVAPHAVRRSVP